jgi:hypothetical protein
MVSLIIDILDVMFWLICIAVVIGQYLHDRRIKKIEQEQRASNAGFNAVMRQMENTK